MHDKLVNLEKGNISYRFLITEHFIMYSGETLKRLRLLKGLNQSGIAKKLGITQQAYSKIEKNQSVDEHKFMQIIRTIGCTDRELDLVRNHLGGDNQVLRA